jgi:hypothetical protein
MQTIRLELSLSVGENQVDDNPRNPVSRAFAALLGGGRPHDSQTLCFLNTSHDMHSEHSKPRWLGVFIQSTGRRILFFPGLISPIDWVEKSRKGSPPIRTSIQLDHISAEPARQRWHFTGIGSGTHLAGGRTPSNGNGSRFWFGLSIKSEESLMAVQKQTIVTHLSPPSDSDRRLAELKRLESQVTYAYVNSDTSEKGPFQPSFLHLCFVLSERSAPDFRGPEFLAPEGSPDLTPPLPNVVPDTRVRLHRIPLSKDWDIQISTVILPGSLRVPAIFTGPETL